MLPTLVVMVLAVAAKAQAGLIVSVQVDSAGMSAPQGRGDSTRADRAGSAGDHLLDFSGGALPTSSGSSSSTTTTTVGSSAVLPQMCGLPSLAFFASLCEEQALRLPASPFFDHLRPPRG